MGRPSAGGARGRRATRRGLRRQRRRFGHLHCRRPQLRFHMLRAKRPLPMRHRKSLPRRENRFSKARVVPPVPCPCHRLSDIFRHQLPPLENMQSGRNIRPAKRHPPVSISRSAAYTPFRKRLVRRIQNRLRSIYRTIRKIIPVFFDNPKFHNTFVPDKSGISPFLILIFPSIYFFT